MKGLSFFLLATHSHCIVEILITPSKTPGRTFQPWPISICQRPPLIYYLELAILSISRLISIPYHIYPFSSNVSAESPEPHPTSRTSDPEARSSNSIAL